MKATVISVYQANVSARVADYQKRVVDRFLPLGWEFRQFFHAMSHADAIAQCVEENKNEITVLLDIDCIPLAPYSLTYLLDNRWSAANGALVGAVQRANHINNKAHLYVGPFCMAFKNSTYKELGSPKFNETYRGDVGEELTYVWQEKSKPVYFLWPSDVEKPLWSLIDKVSNFGLGTTYESLFYHAFCMRTGQTERKFIKKCQEVLQRKEEEMLA